MHLAILQFFNILILLPLVTARALSTLATPVTPPVTSQAPNNKKSTHKHSLRATSGPLPMGKIWCPLASDQLISSWAVNETERAYDLLSASAMLGIWCQYRSFTSILGLPDARNDSSKLHSTSQNHAHLSLPPRSKASWTFGSVKAYVCNYSEGVPTTCDITELEAAKDIIQVACGSNLNVNGKPEPKGGLERYMYSAVVGGVWKSWDEEKQYGFMDASDDREWCEGIVGGQVLPSSGN